MGTVSNQGNQWYEDASLGMFVHWGISSVDATGDLSWGMMRDMEGPESPEAYFEQAEKFEPDDYDPDRWLKAAKQAGMEYAVLTTKHHDGFALWPSEYGEFSTQEYADGRDLVGEFVDACRRHGIKAGFYFSLVDWHHPSWPAHAREGIDDLHAFTDEGRHIQNSDELLRLERYYSYTKGQLKELLTRYGDIDLLWFDTPDLFWGGVHDDCISALYEMARTEQPHIVVNGRGTYTAYGDYMTPEKELPEVPPDGWWELCQPWGEYWGYVEEDEYRDLTWTLRRIAETTSRGGNLLLNVGPKANGDFPAVAYDRLEGLAEWMNHSHPAISGVDSVSSSSKCPHPVTCRTSTWYVHALEGCESPIEIIDVPEPRSVQVLRSGVDLTYTYVDETLRVEMPDGARTSPNEIVVISWPSSAPNRVT